MRLSRITEVQPTAHKYACGMILPPFSRKKARIHAYILVSRLPLQSQAITHIFVEVQPQVQPKSIIQNRHPKSSSRHPAGGRRRLRIRDSRGAQ